MKLKPIKDRVVIRRIEEQTPSVGGLIIPDAAKEKPQIGQVVAVGEGSLAPDGTKIPLSVKIGDRIFFGKYAGVETKLGDDELLILREDEVLALLPGDDPSPIKG